jgi:hypothetical protein
MTLSIAITKHDTQHNDVQYNDAQHIDALHTDVLHNDADTNCCYAERHNCVIVMLYVLAPATRHS